VEVEMKINRTWVTVLPLLAAGLLIACDNKGSGGDTTNAATSASASASAAPQASVPPVASASATPEMHHARMHGGPGSMLFRAASDLPDLKDAQKTTLDKIHDSLKDSGPKTEFKDFQAELITETKAGKIEQAKLDPKMKAIETAMQTNLDKEADALNQLHDALEPAQRKELTTAVRAKRTQMEERFNKMRDGMNPSAAGTPPKPEEMAQKRVDRLTKDLDLDATQQKTILDLATKQAPKPGNPMAMRDDWKKSTDALVDAFEKDTFDAKKLDLYSGANKKGHMGLQHEVDFLAQVVPILKPEQRDKMAARLEKPMMGMGHGGPGGPGGGPGGPGGEGREGRTGFEKHWSGPWQDNDEGPPPAATAAPAAPAAAPK
jgi:Spy/CpxP family protein refolding chaperone